MDYPFKHSRLISQAQLQSKLNHASFQQVVSLSHNVSRLENEEIALYEPQVKGLKYLQEVLNNLKHTIEKQHYTEKMLLDKELQIRDKTCSDSSTIMQTKEGTVDWLNAEGVFALKLGQHLMRLSKLLGDLQTHRQQLKDSVMDVSSIQARLMQKQKSKTKELDVLEKEYKKISSVDTTQVQKSMSTSDDGLAKEVAKDDLLERNQQIQREIAELEKQMKSEFSDTVFLELDMVEEGVNKELNKLRGRNEVLNDYFLTFSVIFLVDM
jgi:hypothetical protein